MIPKPLRRIGRRSRLLLAKQRRRNNLLSPEEVQLAKVGLEEAAKPFTELIRKLFGGVAEEIGGMLQDSFRARRLDRLVTKLLPKLQVRFHESGIDPRQIPDNIWAPALEAATLIDDETLQEKWASLLMNAADAAKARAVQPCFVEILRQLSPSDAKFLDALAESEICMENELLKIYFSRVDPVPNLSNIADHIRYTYILGKVSPEQISQFEVTRGNLIRNQLIEIRTDTTFKDRQIALPSAAGIPVRLELQRSISVEVTGLGSEFVKACRNTERSHG